jgi:hypothetical protein
MHEVDCSGGLAETKPLRSRSSADFCDIFEIASAVRRTTLKTRPPTPSRLTSLHCSADIEPEMDERESQHETTKAQKRDKCEIGYSIGLANDDLCDVSHFCPPE